MKRFDNEVKPYEDVGVCRDFVRSSVTEENLSFAGRLRYDIPEKTPPAAGCGPRVRPQLHHQQRLTPNYPPLPFSTCCDGCHCTVYVMFQSIFFFFFFKR